MTDLRFVLSHLPDSFREPHLLKHVKKAAKELGHGFVGMEIVRSRYASVILTARIKMDRKMDRKELANLFRSKVSHFQGATLTVNPDWSYQGQSRKGAIAATTAGRKAHKTKDSSNSDGVHENWERAKPIADSFYRYVQADPALIERASDREELGRIFQSFLLLSKEQHPDRFLEGIVMSVLRSRKLLRSKRYDGNVVVAFARSGSPGDFPPLEERQSDVQRVLKQRQDLESNKHGVAITTISDVPDFIPNTNGSPLDIVFQASATMEDETTTYLEGIRIEGPQAKAFAVDFACGRVDLVGEAIYHVFFRPNGTGVYRCIVTFDLSQDERKFVITRSLILRTGDSFIQRALQPTTPYQRKPRKIWQKPKLVLDPPSYRESDKSSNPFADLPFHRVPLEVEQMVMNHELEAALEIPTASDIHSYYSGFWKYMLFASEIQAFEDIKLFDIDGAVLGREGKYFVLHVPGLAENRPSVLRGDLVHVTWRDHLYKGRVHQVRLLDILLEFHDSFLKSFNTSLDSVDVRFTFSRTTLRICHEGCAQAPTRMGQRMLYPKPEDVEVAIRSNQPRSTVWLHFANSTLNGEQKEAVTDIFHGQARPLPYLLFGPPGTGMISFPVVTKGRLNQ
jgi:hypothetical protein